jgi:hypothetical protein
MPASNMNCCNQRVDNCREIVEPTITKCIEKEFYHEVPHVCPIHTHVINRHIYKHTYTPQYTCSEENQVINDDCGSCANYQN